MKLLLFFLLLRPEFISHDLMAQFVIWNVGQGQMMSYISETFCVHIDIGGDRTPPLKKIAQLCSQKTNQLLITHYDWDHIQFYNKILRKIPQLCLLEKVPDDLDLKKKKFLADAHLCPAVKNSFVRTIFTPSQFSENQSRIYILNNQWLITGDTPGRSELRILNQLKGLRLTHLILGHHGSKTSTTQALLNHLPDLQQAVVSARKKRYGHPHPIIVQRLQKKAVPLVSTELFGNLHFY